MSFLSLCLCRCLLPYGTVGIQRREGRTQRCGQGAPSCRLAAAVCGHHPACKLLFVMGDFVQKYSDDLFKTRPLEIALATVSVTVETQAFPKVPPGLNGASVEMCGAWVGRLLGQK